MAEKKDFKDANPPKTVQKSPKHKCFLCFQDSGDF